MEDETLPEQSGFMKRGKDSETVVNPETNQNSGKLESWKTSTSAFPHDASFQKPP
ncbi:hypothetical protein LAD54_26800 [Klebsiella pneumoniae]|nr:hypothetical protein [Klebsiella pneumoniae]